MMRTKGRQKRSNKMRLFMKRMTDVTNIRTWEEKGEKDGRFKEIPAKTRVYEINGPLFFATSDIISAIGTDEKIETVIFRMHSIPSLDISALQTLEKVYADYKQKNIRVMFSHVNEQPLSVMKKSGFFDAVGQENFASNIDEALLLAQNQMQNI